MRSVAFVLGTTAEAIKIESVVKALEEIEVKCEIWSTEQQATEFSSTIASLLLKPSSEILSSQQLSIKTKWDACSWALSCLNGIRRLTKRRRTTLPDAIVVQGDTMSTVIGAIAGKILRVPVVHIEAGLRSGDWRSPFPEELDRRIVGKLARLHLAPDECAAANLASSKGRVVVTNGNTGIDSLRLRFHDLRESRKPNELPNITVVLHRTELLSKRDVHSATMNLLGELNDSFNVTMTLDAPSSQALLRFKGDHPGWSDFGVNVIPKQTFPKFVELLASTDLVITDSGGLQEECARLGLPCFVHREVSERTDGLGSNAILTGMNVEKLRELVSNWQAFQRPVSWPIDSPSRICASEIKQLVDVEISRTEL